MFVWQIATIYGWADTRRVEFILSCTTWKKNISTATWPIQGGGRSFKEEATDSKTSIVVCPLYIVFLKDITNVKYMCLDWSAYKDGFGNIYAEFWLGLDTIRWLTNGRIYTLMIVLEDWFGNQRYAFYDKFLVVGNQYTLRVCFALYLNVSEIVLYQDYFNWNL